MLHIKGHEKLTEKQIIEFLKVIDHDFPISISNKTNIVEYARKLYQNGTICFEEDNGHIIAMVAGYTQNTVDNIAYISIVSVLPENRGKGKAKRLVREFISEALKRRLNAVHLYAVRNNTPAMKLYQSIGFVEWYKENEVRKEDVHFIYFLKQKTALITAIGSFSSDIVIKNLKKIGFKTIGCDIYPREWIADALSVSSFYQVPKVLDEVDYLESIDHICKEENITHILPSTDIEVDFFNKYRDFFERKSIIICISSAKTLEVCRNKKKQQMFIDNNVPTIMTIPTTVLDSVERAPYPFPMICKPFDGRSSQGVRYLYTKEDWDAVKAVSNTEKYIVQPVIKGRIITVDIVRQKDGSKIIAVPRAELLRTLNGAGISVKVYSDEKLEEDCKKLAEALDIVGCVNFEFIHAHDGNYYYVECNPRFSGGVEFSCIAGYDCIGNHIRSFENQNIDDFNLTREIYIARKYEEYVTRVN